MKKILAAAASLTLLAAPLAASAQSYGHGGEHGGGYSHGGDHHGGYGADYGRGGYGRGYGHGYDNGGAALAAGAFGLVLGSALASQSYGYDEPYGYSQPYGYAQPYAYEGGYGARCFWRNRAYRDGYGNIEYRQVQICR